MAHIPDERFKNTLYDIEDCLDAITNQEVIKESEKKKAIKLFRAFLDFCMDEAIITSYDLSPLYFRLGLEVKNYGQASGGKAAPPILIESEE